MNKGTVKSFDVSCGVGVISRPPDTDIRFYSESIVGGSRAGLTQGDTVWFEIDDIKNLHVAVKVRKCL